MKSKWLKEKENLEKLILEEKLSYEEIGRRYNCSGSNIKKVALRIGIQLEDRRNINPKETFNKGIIKVKTAICKNCGKEFPFYANSKGMYYSPKNFREDIMREQNYKCAICGMSNEWQDKPLVFIIDHIDGHASHNNRENLRCICPNCDSQLNTYKSKNKNGERSYYRYHKFEQENIE